MGIEPLRTVQERGGVVYICSLDWSLYRVIGDTARDPTPLDPMGHLCGIHIIAYGWHGLPNDNNNNNNNNKAAGRCSLGGVCWLLLLGPHYNSNYWAHMWAK